MSNLNHFILQFVNSKDIREHLQSITLWKLPGSSGKAATYLHQAYLHREEIARLNKMINKD